MAAVDARDHPPPLLVLDAEADTELVADELAAGDVETELAAGPDPMLEATPVVGPLSPGEVHLLRRHGAPPQHGATSSRQVAPISLQ